jgi:hypothetical protein
MEKIIRLLEEHGVEAGKVERTAGPVLNFTSNGLLVSCYISPEYFFHGQAFKKVRDKKETDTNTILREIEKMSNAEAIEYMAYCKSLFFPKKQERLSFQRETKYRHFSFEGDIIRNSKNLITLLKMPIECVIKIQNEYGKIHLVKDEDLSKRYIEIMNKFPRIR